MEDVQTNLATNLRRYRNKAGISQEELADRANIDRTYVSGIERGVRNPTVRIVARLAAELGATVAELLRPPRQ
jgi:transcriptional regulator with XRE-family HTH domain